jgi:hypothetical protein
MEHETFWSLLHDAAHWEFELFLIFVFDVVLGLLVWPFVRKHWKHHVERDARETKDNYLSDNLTRFKPLGHRMVWSQKKQRFVKRRK